MLATPSAPVFVGNGLDFPYYAVGFRRAAWKRAEFFRAVSVGSIDVWPQCLPPHFALPANSYGGRRQQFTPATYGTMSSGTTMSLEVQMTAPSPVGVGSGRIRRRSLGAMLFEAQMTDVATFDFLGGSVAVFTTRS